MIQTIKTIDLKVGMYVILPNKWRNHAFEKIGFPITSQQDLRAIIESGFTEVRIDTEKAIPAENESG